ncbi:MAG: type II toxin-antitoxin system VapC family toxin [Pseudomonadota bacterium]
MKSTLYLETTVSSYYVSRPSRDIVVLAHQEITRIWWDRRLPLFDVYISPIVLEEIGRGDPEQADKRLRVLSSFLVLEATTHVENLAKIYVRELAIPPKAMRDAAHLAFACAYGVDYLVTWNCAHIANAEIRRRLTTVNVRHGIETPVICTPEELMGREEI